MRLLYIIPTRARPLNLLGTINTAWRLRSGRHAVEFATVLDRDDDAAREAIAQGITGQMPAESCRFHLVERPDALGAKWNAPLQHRAMPFTPVDAALLMTDRMIPITVGWDDVVAQSLDRFPNRILWWRCPSDPGTVAPVVPRSWLEAMDWKPAVEAYPYWFIDTHLMELDRLVYGGPSLMMPAFYAGERKETQQLRDCAFWCRYYAALRPQRVAQARVIAERLSVAWVDRPELLAEFGSHDAGRLHRAAEFEAAFGDKSEPWEGYRRIKAEAEARMNALTDWEYVKSIRLPDSAA